MGVKFITFFAVVIFIAVKFFSVNSLEKARYDNYKVYEILIKNEEQLKLMRHIDDNPDGVSRS